MFLNVNKIHIEIGLLILNNLKFEFQNSLKLVLYTMSHKPMVNKVNIENIGLHANRNDNADR